MIKLRTFDKAVLWFVFLLITLRAPYIVLPVLLFGYLAFVFLRSAKQKIVEEEVKAKKKETKARIEALEIQVQHMQSVINDYEKTSKS